MASPLSSIPLINSIQFGAYEFTKQKLGVCNEIDFTFRHCVIAGVISGIAVTPIVAGSELVKCRL